MHALLRRVSMFWNTSPHAADIADAATHSERLKLALHAVKATDMLGLRSAADEIFKGECMRDNLINSALHADKVAPLCN
jgi:hypothetical protein